MGLARRSADRFPSLIGFTFGIAVGLTLRGGLASLGWRSLREPVGQSDRSGMNAIYVARRFRVLPVRPIDGYFRCTAARTFASTLPPLAAARDSALRAWFGSLMGNLRDFWKTNSLEGSALRLAAVSLAIFC